MLRQVFSLAKPDWIGIKVIDELAPYTTPWIDLHFFARHFNISSYFIQSERTMTMFYM